MIYGFNQCIRFVHSLLSLSKTKTMNINKCYFRHIEHEDKVDIAFLFNVKNTLRQFNLSRKSSEGVQSLCTRIGTNVQKVVNKKVKKKAQSEESNIPVQILDEKQNAVPDMYTCIQLFQLGPLKIKISDQFYDLVFNAPWVINFNLPKCILVGFPVYPENLETKYADKSISIFNWYRAKDVNENGNPIMENHINWEFVANTFYYTPTLKDIGMKLKLECIPKNINTTGPSVEVISKSCVEAGPGPCPFETRHLFTKNKLKNESFRCVTYNILADLYCDSDYTRTVLHPYCPPYALEIDYRKQLILKELLGYNADIICLQEVDKKVFDYSLSCLLENEGLKGLFYKKGKTVAEGLSCFYRENRFRCIGDEKILLADAIKTESYLKPIWDAIEKCERLKARLLDRSSVASATILHSLDNEKEILIVGNTHLYFHPDADHIRLIQGGIVIHWLQTILKLLQTEHTDKRISIILCGDFNSDPSSGIYKLYTTGKAPSTLQDWKSNPEEAVSDLSLSQDIQLGSACGTPQYTNFTEGFADCLDYIYYDTSNLEVVQVVPFPSVEELKAHTALPSIVFPSDHIAVVSDIKFKPL
ncbi:2',5'-phosphodiesterase 12 [Colias croceus]|uniref:2',5'-phosphodiesterase 12 n=1 Tax=Colias crocea TaxID=72248 RepID=UPI001E27C724|nr:2',5'-phosphodiesterase 12 [Colias croceus]